MRLSFTLAVLLVLPAAASAEQELFSCVIKGGKNQLSLAADGADLIYRFGPLNSPPQLELRAALASAPYAPWSGMGRAMSELVSFSNDGFTYDVYLSFDRLDPQARWEGGVTVAKADSVQASLECEPDSLAANLEPIHDMMRSQAGLCWQPGEGVWTEAACGG